MLEFDELLVEATQAIETGYFQLPVAGKEDPSYRERVYCYELYHQLRLRWPKKTDYGLTGEVDKSGHPLVRGNGLDNTKPDLLVHVRGDMGGNFAVIEVKSIRATPGGLRKDLRTLTAFRLHAEYERAILLVYGSGKDINDLLQRLPLIAAGAEQIRLDQIEVWWHPLPDQPALRVA